MAYADKEVGKAKNRELYRKNRDEINEQRRKQREQERDWDKGKPRNLAIEWLRKPLK